MSDLKEPVSAVERILRRGAPHHEPEEEAEEEAHGAFGELRMARRRGREALMLDVRKADGQCYGMSYAYLTRIDFHPGDLLKLHFADAVVQIGGRRLKDLYSRLLEHRVDSVQEGTDIDEGLKPEEAPHIERIQLITPTEARHDEG